MEIGNKPRRSKQLRLGLALERAPEDSTRFSPHRRRAPWVFTVFRDPKPEPTGQLPLLPGK